MNRSWGDRQEQWRRFNERERCQSLPDGGLTRIGEILDLYRELPADEKELEVRLQSNIQCLQQLHKAPLKASVTT